MSASFNSVDDRSTGQQRRPASSGGRLTDGPVRRRLFELWLPMIGGALSVKAIDLADAYFVGQLGDAPLAAISFAFPAVMTLISIAIGLDAGASSVLSRVIGEGGSTAEQQAVVTAGIALSVVLATVLAVAGFLLIGPLLALLGATGAVLADATAFMQIWFGGALFLIVPIVAGGLLRSTGDGLTPALLMAAIAVLNIGLNPVFIFGAGPITGLGMEGAAMATVIARALATVVAVVILVRRSLLILSMSTLRDGLSRWRPVTRIALPASLSTSLNPIALGIATAAVATLGTAEVAAFGIATRIQEFVIVPLLALSATSSPLVGQNSAAGAMERSRHGLYWCAAISLTWSAALALALLPGAGWLVDQFDVSAAARDHAALYLWIVPLSFAGFGIVVAASAAMNGLGRPVTALLLSGGRAMLLLAPAAWIGVLLAGFPGLAAGTALANVAAGLAAFVVVRRHSLTTHGRDAEASPERRDWVDAGAGTAG